MPCAVQTATSLFRRAKESVLEATSGVANVVELARVSAKEERLADRGPVPEPQGHSSREAWATPEATGESGSASDMDTRRTVGAATPMTAPGADGANPPAELRHQSSESAKQQMMLRELTSFSAAHQQRLLSATHLTLRIGAARDLHAVQVPHPSHRPDLQELLAACWWSEARVQTRRELEREAGRVNMVGGEGVTCQHARVPARGCTARAA